MFGLSTPVVIIILTVSVASGVFAARIAQAKGYSVTGWFACGFFFNILALVAITGLPASSANRPDEQPEETVSEIVNRMYRERAARAAAEDAEKK